MSHAKEEVLAGVHEAHPKDAHAKTAERDDKNTQDIILRNC